MADAFDPEPLLPFALGLMSRPMAFIAFFIAVTAKSPSAHSSPWSEQALEALKRIDGSADTQGSSSEVPTSCKNILANAFREHLKPPQKAAKTNHNQTQTLHLVLREDSAQTGLKVTYTYDDGGPLAESRIDVLPQGWAVLLSRTNLPRGSIAIKSARCVFVLSNDDPFSADYVDSP